MSGLGERTEASRALVPYRRVALYGLTVLWTIGMIAMAAAWPRVLSLRGQELTVATFGASRLWLWWIGFVPWFALLLLFGRLRRVQFVLLDDEFEVVDIRAARNVIPYDAVTRISHGSRAIDSREPVPRAGSLRIAYHDSTGSPRSVWLPLPRIADRDDLKMVIRGICDSRRRRSETARG